MPSKTKVGYLPSLDGWRAIAILGVLLTHDQGRFQLHLLNRFRDVGYMGVYIFFSISGLLVTWRLLEDERAHGFLDIKGFYIRRLFRIQPAAWIYLLALLPLMCSDAIVERWPVWFGALFMVRNFLFHDLHENADMATGWFTGHFWTLSVEEHFYILLSLFFLLIKRSRTATMLALFAALITGQQIARHFGLFSGDTSPRRTYWVIQYLLFGTLLQLVLNVDWVRKFTHRWLRPWVAFTGTLLVLEILNLATGGNPSMGPFLLAMKKSNALFYCFAFWVVSTAIHPHSWTTRLLEVRPLRFVGRLSYGLYLWQQLFFHDGSPETKVHWKVLAWAGRRPQHYLAVFLFALASYYLLERPMIRLGHRLAPPATAGHRDLQVATAGQ